jgi:uncharacterized protein involved in exopolysaccharide biosynthesis
VCTDPWSLQELLRTVWERKLLVGTTALAFTAVAIVLALTATPMYRAQVAVTEVADPSANGAVGLGQISGLASLIGGLAGGSSSQDARAFLESRRLVEEFIRRNQLVPKLIPEGSKPATLWFAVEKFRGRVLSISDDTRTGAKVIRIDWMDPQIAARWANDFVALANELIRLQALDASSRNIDYLKEQIDETSVVEMRQIMYNLLETEMKTHMLANGRAEYAFRVIDPAVPPEVRFSPRRTLMVLFGGLLGTCVGVGAAFALQAAAEARRRSENSYPAHSNLPT